MRSGVIARKLGMTAVFVDSGVRVPVTVLHLDGCKVVSHRTRERDGYVALQLGAGYVRAGKLPRAAAGHFAEGKVEPRRKLAEFRVSPDGLIGIGSEFSADHFVPGQYVDVTGTSIGKGFTGAMKRHNFGGLRASHGVSISHRSHGSTGGCQDPGKVFKNKKMAGRCGGSRVTVQCLKVVSTDVERGLVMVRGAVPGAKGGWVYLRDSIKRPVPDSVPRPGSFCAPGVENDVSAQPVGGDPDYGVGEGV